MFFIKRNYFNKTLIIKGLCTALLFSGFLYLSHFGFEFKILHTILGLSALYFLLTIERSALFIAGFFIGILWFYWISFSFSYYDLNFLIPLIILGIGLFYGVIFLLLAAVNHPIFRIFAIVLLSFFEPFGFNWLKPELLFVHSYFEPSKLLLILLLISTYFLLKGRVLTYAALIVTCFFISSTITSQAPLSQLDIELPSFNLKQEDKWNRDNLNNIIAKNFKIIDKAIANKKDLVVLPETAFPLILNVQDALLNELKEKSQNITIVTGALYKENNAYNNSTYVFQKGEFEVAHKVVLVPFGEAVPFPEIIRNFINDIFYEGAQDYAKAAQPTDFKIGTDVFRNAICYEATTDTIFKNLKDVKFMIATSNNAWFTPSVEPTLQRILLQYFAKKYNITIYHVANGSQNAIIQP